MSGIFQWLFHLALQLLHLEIKNKWKTLLVKYYNLSIQFIISLNKLESSFQTDHSAFQICSRWFLKRIRNQPEQRIKIWVRSETLLEKLKIGSKPTGEILLIYKKTVVIIHPFLAFQFFWKDFFVFYVFAYFQTLKLIFLI